METGSALLLLLATAAVSPTGGLDPTPAFGGGDGEQRPPTGLLLGTATVIAPLVAGSILLSQDGHRTRQAAGVITIATGFAAAPWVAHGVQGAWRRAVIFGSISAATSAAALAAASLQDILGPDASNRKQVPFAILLTCALASSTVGVVSSVFDRGGPLAAPRVSLWAAPSAGGVALAWSTAR